MKPVNRRVFFYLRCFSHVVDESEATVFQEQSVIFPQSARTVIKWCYFSNHNWRRQTGNGLQRLKRALRAGKNSDEMKVYCDFLMNAYGKRLAAFLRENVGAEFCERDDGNTILLTDHDVPTWRGPLLRFDFEDSPSLDLCVSAQAQPWKRRNAYESMSTLKRDLNACLGAPVNLCEASVSETRKTGLWSVFSPIGGCGKTTFAMALCEALAARFRSQKVLYFSIQGAEDWPLYFRDPSSLGVGHLLYNLLVHSDVAEVDDYVQEVAMGQENGVFFIRPCDSFSDVNALSAQELDTLFGLLKKYFDYVICDMNNAFESVNRQILAMSERRFYVVSDRVVAIQKWDSFCQSIDKQRLGAAYFGATDTLVTVGNGAASDAFSFPGQRLSLPQTGKLLINRGGIYSLRQDSEYYANIQQFVGSLRGSAQDGDR